MNKFSFFLIAFLSCFGLTHAQDVSIDLSNVNFNWGWGGDVSYKVSTPDPTTGVGCDSATVTLIDLNMGYWSGVFSLQFSNTTVADWSKYESIDLLIYTTAPTTFDDSVTYVGWDNINSKNLTVSVNDAMETTTTSIGEWQILSLDITKTLVDDSTGVVYPSLGSSDFNVSNVICAVGLGASTAKIYIGGITFKEKSVVTSFTVAGKNGATSLRRNETLQMIASNFEPSTITDSSVVWSVSDESIAKIDATSGLLTPVALGSVTVYAQAQLGGLIKSTSISVEQSNDATLKSLTADIGTLSPDFSASTTEYVLTFVAGNTTVPTITATANDANASVSITQASYMEGTATVRVTAEDGTTTKTYTVNFYMISNDATLGNLATDAGLLTPDFAIETTEYTVILDSGTTTVPTITVLTSNPNAKVSITPANSLSESMVILVTAEDGVTTKTYTVSFYVKSDDATLKSLTADIGTLSPDFSASTTEYVLTFVAGNTTVPTITATANDANASVSITQASYMEGTATVRVTAEDGTTTKTYTVNFYMISNDATLGNLATDAGLLTPDFAIETTEYTVILDSGTTTVPTITVLTSDPNAKVSITPANSLSESMVILVTAEDGVTTKTYTVSFYVKSDDATLKSLTADAGTISPDFSADITSYTVTLPVGTTAIPTITAIATDTKASVNVTSASSLSGTTNIRVEAEDGVTIKTYTVSFHVKSNDATLYDLSSDAGTMSPEFSADITSYTVTLAAGTTTVPTITAAANSSYATVSIADASSLSESTNVLVTAEDGTTKTYTVNFKVNSTGIDTPASSSVAIYPNPTTDFINIVCDNAKTPYISVYSLTGSLLYSGRTNQVDVSSFVAGMYLVDVDGIKYKIIKK
ncbi:MAG: beta strand repeat-containing protein [Bacteroidales bacterium]